jgi:hypothetical protein
VAVAVVLEPLTLAAQVFLVVLVEQAMGVLGLLQQVVGKVLKQMLVQMVPVANLEFGGLFNESTSN